MLDPLLLALVLAIPILLAVVFFTWYLWQESLDRKVDRFNKLHRYIPDHLGNYPALFEPRSNISFLPEPGNSPHPKQEHFIVSGGNATPVKREKNLPPVVINSPYPVVRDVRPEQLEQPKNEPEQAAEQLEQPEQERDFVHLLAQAKQQGKAPTTAIQAITGVPRGSSKAFKTWLEIWDKL